MTGRRDRPPAADETYLIVPVLVAALTAGLIIGCLFAPSITRWIP
jgi:hypothetical protein